MKFSTNETSTFSAFEAGALVGTIHFRIDKQHNIYIIEHVIIEPAFLHQGLGTILMQTFMDQLHRKEIYVFPVCPFAKKFLESHPYSFVDWNYTLTS